ncbi:MAG: hypothetical protein R2867_29820 [Caldilineaceae bacterium]
MNIRKIVDRPIGIDVAMDIGDRTRVIASNENITRRKNPETFPGRDMADDICERTAIACRRQSLRSLLCRDTVERGYIVVDNLFMKVYKRSMALSWRQRKTSD